MRNLSPAMTAAITARVVVPAVLADLTFRSSTEYVWTGYGNLVAYGNTYKGVGSLGAVGAITENTTVEAAGTEVTLSGVDPTIYAETTTELVTGLPAKLWLACLAGNAVVDRMLLFSGFIDQPTVTENPESIEIKLALESKLTNLRRAYRKLWTDLDQRRDHPNDSGFAYVTELQDTQNSWGG